MQQATSQNSGERPHGEDSKIMQRTPLGLILRNQPTSTCNGECGIMENVRMQNKGTTEENIVGPAHKTQKKTAKNHKNG